MNKEEEKPTCSHFQKKGHEEEKCWKLHLVMLPNKFMDKGKQKSTTIVQQYLDHIQVMKLKP